LALAHFGLANAAHRAGNIDDARREFNIFFDVWKDADVNLPILRTARREYLQLAR
jgi:hypothetical protein